MKACLFFVVLTLLVSSCTDEEYTSKYSKTLSDTTAATVVFTHQASQGYATVYPANSNLFYTDVVNCSDSNDVDTLSVKIIFNNTYQNFTGYTFFLDGIKQQSLLNDAFVFRFPRKAKENIYHVLQVHLDSSVYQMKVSFDPKQFLVDNGKTTSENGFFIHETNITFQEIPSAKFIAYTLNEQEKNEARKEFAIPLQETKTAKEKVQRITSYLLDKLAKSRGVPSDSMNGISPLEQYKRALCGKDEVWCGNLANIFLYACSSYDVPARLISLGNTFKEVGDPLVYHADHHSIAEVYYDETWHLVDMSFYILDAKLKDGRVLNFIDFWHLMNIPQERKNIVITQYDLKEKRLKDIPVEKALKFDRLMTYYKQNQKFSFVYSKENGVGFYTF
jgi:hypothetical protein